MPGCNYVFGWYNDIDGKREILVKVTNQSKQRSKKTKLKESGGYQDDQGI